MRCFSPACSGARLQSRFPQVHRARGRLSRGGDAGVDGVVELNPFVIAAEREYNAAAIAINEQRFAASKREVVLDGCVWR